MANVMGWDENLEGFDESGAIAPNQLARMRQGRAAYGAMIQDHSKAALWAKKASKSKSAHARATAAILKQLQMHELMQQAEDKKSPSVLVNVFFSQVTTLGLSYLATVKTPYSGRRFALVAIETFALRYSAGIAVTEGVDPFLFTTFNLGGVELASTPTSQSVSYAAGGGTGSGGANGFPSATFGTLNTQRMDAKVHFSPWSRRSHVFRADDTLSFQVSNQSPDTWSLFMTLKMLSSPCAGNQQFKMEKVPSRFWSKLHNQMYRH